MQFGDDHLDPQCLHNTSSANSFATGNAMFSIYVCIGREEKYMDRRDRRNVIDLDLRESFVRCWLNLTAPFKFTVYL